MNIKFKVDAEDSIRIDIIDEDGIFKIHEDGLNFESIEALDIFLEQLADARNLISEGLSS